MIDVVQVYTTTTPCAYCSLPIEPSEKGTHGYIEGRNGAWAHVTCWYDGGPFERERWERGWR